MEPGDEATLVRCSITTCKLSLDRLSNYLFILCNLQARARNDCVSNLEHNRKTRTITEVFRLVVHLHRAHVHFFARAFTL